MPTTHKTTAQAGQHITRLGYHWGPVLGGAVTLSFAFRTSGATYTVLNHNISQFSAFSASEQSATRAALQLWADAANLNFVDQGNSNSATLLFQNYRDPNDCSQAFAHYPISGDTSTSSPQGDVFMNLAFASTTVNPGDYNWATLIHEIGHALGLQHPGDYNAAPGVKITYAQHAEYIEDSLQYSIMSYFSETSTGANYQGVSPETPMLHDIAAIQRLYGANMTTRTGNTTYGFNSNAGTPYAINSAAQKVVYTVWDAGGTDTFDFSGYSQDQTINLNAESFSHVGGLTSNVAIALNVTIENAKGGSGNDTLIGNAADNILTGGLGNDTLDGGGGVDRAVFSSLSTNYTLTGLSGNGVRVSGPDGTDTLSNIEFLVFTNVTLNWPPSAADDYADSFADATAPFGLLAPGGSLTGAIETNGDKDWFRIQLSANIQYTFNLQGLGAGATLQDPYLRLFNSTGGFIADDDDTIGLDPQLVFTPTTSGTYYLEASEFGDNATGTYRISVVGGGANDDFADSLNDVTASIGQVSVNGSRNGSLETTGDRDWIRVTLTAGTSYTINVQGLNAGVGTLEDPYLRLHSSSGALVAENDDIDLGVDRDSRLTYQATTSGFYYIETGAYNDEYTGTYRVSVTTAAAGDDFADSRNDNTAPFGQVSVGGSSTGRLEVKGDRDWFQVQLVGGTVYEISLDGQNAGQGTLEDPYLRLRNSAGTLIAQNDDIVLGVDRDSNLIAQINQTGTYYIEAGAFDDNYTGTYRVTVATTQSPDDFADSLTDVSHPIGQATLTGSATGTLELAGDRDWFQIQLAAGSTYAIDLKGKSAGGTLADPYLRLYNNVGSLILQNDDSAGANNRDSQILFTPSTSGTYYIEAGAYVDGLAGTYTVFVSHSIRGDNSPNGLIGTAQNDSILGFASSDVMSGGAGADVLVGGAGWDMMTGGSDTDIFDFNRASETRVGLFRDVILDFLQGEDRIDLFDIDARSGAGNQAFKWIGLAKFHHQKGELHYKHVGGNTIIEGDLNGDRKADFQIELDGLVSLTKADFIL